jgi:hypothetical protein
MCEQIRSSSWAARVRITEMVPAPVVMGKAIGIEQDIVDIRRVAAGLGRLFFAFDRVVGGQQLPAHAADHDPAGQLDDGDGDAEQFEDPAADQGGDDTDGKAIKGHLFCGAFTFREARDRRAGVHDECGADGVDGREKGKEPEEDKYAGKVRSNCIEQYYIKLRVSTSTMRTASFFAYCWPGLLAGLSFLPAIPGSIPPCDHQYFRPGISRSSSIRARRRGRPGLSVVCRFRAL